MVPYRGMLAEASHSPQGTEAAPVTDALFGALEPADVTSIRSMLSPEHAALVSRAAAADQRRLLLHLGVHHRVPSVLSKTGLSPATPPEDVHAMSRGPLAAGGTLWYADVIVDALARAGAGASPERVLDFGASSGRVARVLRQYWREADMAACDPNAAAIEWAGEHLQGIDFFTSPTAPPLDRPSGGLDLVYAISIWSHYAARPAIAWLDEMHRLLRPGGILLLTFHGLHSLGYYRRQGLRSPAFLAGAARDWVRDGFHFFPIFGSGGDWGVSEPGWGESYMSLDWLAGRLSPGWALLHHRMGSIEGNQDLAVLQKRAGPESGAQESPAPPPRSGRRGGGRSGPSGAARA